MTTVLRFCQQLRARVTARVLRQPAAGALVFLRARRVRGEREQARLASIVAGGVASPPIGARTLVERVTREVRTITREVRTAATVTVVRASLVVPGVRPLVRGVGVEHRGSPAGSAGGAGLLTLALSSADRGEGKHPSRASALPAWRGPASLPLAPRPSITIRTPPPPAPSPSPALRRVVLQRRHSVERLVSSPPVLPRRVLASVVVSLAPPPTRRPVPAGPRSPSVTTNHRSVARHFHDHRRTISIAEPVPPRPLVAPRPPTSPAPRGEVKIETRTILAAPPPRLSYVQSPARRTAAASEKAAASARPVPEIITRQITDTVESRVETALTRALALDAPQMIRLGERIRDSLFEGLLLDRERM